jgi:hypothetical protein
MIELPFPEPEQPELQKGAEMYASAPSAEQRCNVTACLETLSG